MTNNTFAHIPGYLYADEGKLCDELLNALSWDEQRACTVNERARIIVAAARQTKQSSGQLESFLQQYSLNTEEGLALMTLAEALLRIPDKATANKLIRDKVEAANWLDDQGSSQDWVVKAAGVGMMMSRKSLSGVLCHMAEPVIRASMIKAMRVMGGQFVLGDNIENAMINAQPQEQAGYRMSYDMLGEGARTATDADHYFENYKHAITYVGQRRAEDDLKPAGISVKLSALHPRYDAAQKEICLSPMIARVKELAALAMRYNIPMTIDAEEADRLIISLDIINAILEDEKFANWNGFGMAVQAYQKRAYPILKAIEKRLEQTDRYMQIRLVKGAYWDTEIKHAQMMGYEGYSVFTRKPNTDLSYLACAEFMMESPRIYPMFATHNAHTIAGILTMAGDEQSAGIDYEFQRLHGMGESVFGAIMDDQYIGAVSVYAPVGPHADLLPYLVRRLLENGANSSFVNKLLDESVSLDSLIKDPIKAVKGFASAHHPQIPLPLDIYKTRRNSQGLDLKDMGTIKMVESSIQSFKKTWEAYPLIDGKPYKNKAYSEPIENPSNRNEMVGTVYNADPVLFNKTFRKAKVGFQNWNATSIRRRAQIIEAYADLLERNRDEFITLCVKEAGKTILDAVAEIREAVDFCRYYALQARKTLRAQPMPGYTGESNILKTQGRGVFVCVSPWNYPLAIFTGQITAALVAGNSVIAKPAEQTPLIALRAIELMHEAGVPYNAIHLITGDGSIGAGLVAHKDVAGVAFTGSNDTAQDISATLAGKTGAIVPFIAETGGQNAMIVDSSALLEQVIDDVLISAFGAAGQRCSALRVLYLQDDIADKAIRLLKGAMQEINIGEPALVSTDIGPVIDDGAYAMLVKHRKSMDGQAHKIAEAPMPKRANGHFFAPCAYEIQDMNNLHHEVFGPILHVIRYSSNRIDDVIADINATNFGLTLSIHSRIETTQNYIAQRVNVGNVYINRNQIGAIVGTQPFGGMGISGTGPKAGGPHYLNRFVTEKHISTDTTACGGNATLVSLGE